MKFKTWAEIKQFFTDNKGLIKEILDNLSIILYFVGITLAILNQNIFTLVFFMGLYIIDLLKDIKEKLECSYNKTEDKQQDDKIDSI